MALRRILIVIAMPAILLVAGVGCGGGGSDTAASAATEGAAPANLVGTYAMTLKPSDVPPNPAPELTDRAERWTLKIANNGGMDGGPAFTIINDQLGTLESSRFGVDGDRIVLHDEECAVAPAPVESEYAWTLSGSSLRFSEVTNGCDDDVVLTLLTSEPWRKHG
jgi:hypothetical protein